MSNNILFVFEGAKTEDQIVRSLQNFFINENTVVKCIYGAEIYQIYKAIIDDEDLDTFNLLKEREPEHNQILNDYNRNDFAEIYLFFDYDGHSTLADDNKLAELLNFFCEETDKGKLFVSYPMVECLKHIVDFDNFWNLTVQCKNNISYKTLVHDTCLKHLSDFRKYDLDIWKKLVIAHLMKMNFIVNSSYSFPDEIVRQIVIFSHQQEKYINLHSTVSVISAFPVFLHDYYGNENIKKRIQ
jgi:hypothetical protein